MTDPIVEQNFRGGTVPLALSAMLLGMALQVNDGLYSPLAVALLALSLLACVLGLFRDWGRVGERTLAGVLAAMGAAEMIAMMLHRAGASEVTVTPTAHWPVVAGAAVALAALGLVMFGKRQLAVAGFVLMLAAFTALGAWKIQAAPDPRNDVFLVHTDSAEALEHGINPYTITFPDIYGPDAHVYAPELVRDRKLQFGYTYPPLPLLLTTLAHAVFGDFRFADLLVILATAVLLAVIRPGRIGMLIAALFLFTPRVLYVIEMGWTEPLSLVLLAATAACLCRAQTTERFHKWLPVPLGLLIASKQYLPAVLFFPGIRGGRGESPRTQIKTTALALVVASVVTAPFLLWDFQAIWHSLIEVQWHLVYRPDALNFTAWWGSMHPGWIGPSWPGFAALLVAIGVSYWRRLSFTAAFVICYFVFFAFGRQAFANYYYLLIGAMACELCLQTRADVTDDDSQLRG